MQTINTQTIGKGIFDMNFFLVLQLNLVALTLKYITHFTLESFTTTATSFYFMLWHYQNLKRVYKVQRVSQKHQTL